MKKIIIISLFLFIAAMSYTHVEVKADAYYSGNSYYNGKFRYDYQVEKQGVWIIKITPLSSKGIATLRIPSRINGQKVVKLGARGDMVTNEDQPDYDTNLFGVTDYDEGTGLSPQKIHKRVKKIKTIKIPSTVKKITQNCFKHLQDGKNINIPAGVTENVILSFTRVKWNKITVSAQNKEYKIKNGCLLSKNGKKLYGFVQKKKKIVIPSTVKRIVNDVGDYNGCSTMVIPKSVNKIDKGACSAVQPVKVEIAKGNKRYAVKYGSVYSKVSGRLVLGYINNGVLKIPEKVTRIDGHGFLGWNLEKVIIPAGVKKIRGFYDLRPIHEGELTCVFYCKNPPELVETFVWEDLTIYVPGKCKGKYMKQWKQLLEDDPFYKITFIELQ